MRRHGWKLAVALVVLVTGWVVAGAAWNRSGEPEAELVLTERELPVAPVFLQDESSGVSLRLVTSDGLPWPLAPADDRDRGWLDASALAAIGFDVSLPADGQQAQAKVDRQAHRRAWAALELEGAAWKDWLRRATAAAEVEGKDRPERQAALARARASASRLFMVEVGPDPEVLRARHPDRGQILIAPVEVWPWLERDYTQSTCRPPSCRVVGHAALLVDEVTVPRALQRGLPAQEREGRSWWYVRMSGSDTAPRYEVVLRSGRRHEPWIAAIRPLGAP